jgi:hypothetical protein
MANINTPIDPKVYQQILHRLDTFSKRVDKLSNFIIAGGIISIVSALFISAFVGSLGVWEHWIIRIVSFVSALTLTLLGAFNVAKKLSDIRSAWMSLNKAVFQYESKMIDASELIRVYQEAENLVGPVEFNYQREDPGSN